MGISMKILLIILFIFTLILCGLYGFVNIKGESLLINKLQDILDREVKVGSVKVYFPFNIVVKDIEIKDVCKIDRAFAGGGVIDILRKDYILPELILSGLRLDLGQPSKKATPQVTPGQEAALSPLPAAATPTPVPGKTYFFSQFYIGRLVINDSIFSFVDTKATDKGVKITIKDLNIKLENIKFPVQGSNIISFELRGKIPWQQQKEDGRIKIKGWINLFKRDMQASLNIERIDGIYLYPYYSTWVDLEKSRINKAKLNFTSNIRGLNNDVTAECALELTDIVFKPRASEEPPEKAERIAVAVLGIFKELNQGKVVLPFTFKTKMDSPEFNVAFIRNAFEQKLMQRKSKNGFSAEDLFKLPVKLIEGTVKGATDITKAVITGTVSAGMEVKNIIENSFKKEEKEESSENPEKKE